MFLCTGVRWGLSGVKYIIIVAREKCFKVFYWHFYEIFKSCTYLQKLNVFVSALLLGMRSAKADETARVS